MILLADGGSTKVDWRLVDKGREVARFTTKGANPFFRTREEISREIAGVLMPGLDGLKIDAVHFFGAGCAFPEKNESVRAAITDNLSVPSIEVASDLLAAARGLCGREAGIACILGTGSNSCYYDGREIKETVPPLGYILGDEGSGAVLGRLLVNACLKNRLTPGMREKFLDRYRLTPAEILENVYKKPLPNRFLAGLSPFLLENIGDTAVRRLVYDSFVDFLRKNVMQYDYLNNYVHFTGSIAYFYREVLAEAADGSGIRLGTVAQSPMEGLIKYYA